MSIAQGYDDGLRMGAFGYLGSNEFASFVVNYTAIIIGILMYSKNIKAIVILLLSVASSIYPIVFSYSRGAYVAFASTVLFFAMFKKKLIIALTVLLILSSIIVIPILPPSVLERVTMTKTEEGELESSAGGRLMLWNHAIDNIFFKHPILGGGFGMFSYFPSKEGIYYSDPHSSYVEILSELGIVGLAIFLYLLLAAFRSGWLLYKTSNDSFFKGLGLGFCACVIACATANLFGDRWSYIQLIGYFWIIWALVDRGYIIEKASRETSEKSFA
jgi:O-antigen ligase